MLTACMLLVVAIPLLGVGIYLKIKLNTFVEGVGQCIESDEKYLPHAKESKYYAKYQYFWNGVYMVSSDKKASKEPFPTGREYKILINPNNPTEIILSSDAKNAIFAIIIGALLLIASIAIFIVL